MNYEDFLNERRKLIAQVIRERFERLPRPCKSKNLHVPQSENLEDLIMQGESNTLEFKSSMRAPTKLTDSIMSKEKALERTTGPERTTLEQVIIKEKKFRVKSLELEVFKTVSAFMNSGGGVLLIGVDDDGRISGIEKDYETFSDKKDWDGWQQHFTNLIVEHIGIDVMIYIKLLETIFDGKTVARIEVRRSSKPIYVEYQDIKGQDKMEFYIRATGTTYALSPKQTNDYIKERWKGR